MGGRRNSTRKIITRVIAFLLLGAIVNVAVAWGCAFAAIDYFQLRQFDPYASFGHRQRRGAVEKFAEWAERELQEEHSIEGTRTGLGRYVVFHESGWPTLAMSSIRYELTAYVPLGLGGGQRYEFLGQGIPLRTSQIHLLLMGPKQLPLRPIWPGFAINTLFYAGILWLLFAAPFALRRRRRIKRGLCPACAYPIGDSQVCTECGKPVQQGRGPHGNTATS